jgi:exodeoxyribonuclease V gamma subunit
MKATYSSNFIEILSEKLKKNLRLNVSNSDSYIFIPNKITKSYLMKSFCDDENYKISFDIKFVNINNFISFLKEKLELSNEHILSYIGLSFVIRERLEGIIQRNDNRYQEIIRYLLKSNGISEKRLNSLCDELTQVFINYSIYGNFEDLKVKKQISWQADLFYEIFYEDKYFLPFRDFKRLDISKLDNCHFHFFSLGHIPPLFFDLAHKFSNVYHYINSPCMFYWEDIASDLERYKIQKLWKKRNLSSNKIGELDVYLKDRNSFLANMEKLKRNYLKTLSQYDEYQDFDYYLINEEEEKSLSFLEIFKKDILYLENRNLNNIMCIDKLDSSFQVDSTTSKFMEVKILFSNILKLLSKDDEMQPSDIHVIIPNVDEYIQFIHMVFNDKEAPFAYKVLGLNLDKQSSLISGMLKILSFINSKWSRSDVFDLLENELVLNKIKISKEEKEVLFEYLEKANIKWGLDKNHIDRYLNYKQEQEVVYLNSWEDGIARILSGFTFMLNQNNLGKDFSFYLPISGQDSLDIELFDKFLKFFSDLVELIKNIEKENLLPIKEWIKLFNRILSFFDVKDNFIEKIAFDSCKNFLKELKELSSKHFEERFSFEFIKNHFIKYINGRKTNHNSNSMQAVTISSFDLASISAKAVFIIGLDDQSFNFDENRKLDLINKNEVPSANDVRRSAFLQSLLSAEKYLYLSFSSATKNINEASIVVQDLFSYLDNSYLVENKKPSDTMIVDHPSFPFHESYFNKKNNFSQNDFSAAKKYYEKDFKKNNFLHEKTDIPDAIDIQVLRSLCKNSIKFYLNKKLEIYLEEKKTENEFSLSFLDKYLIKKSFLEEDIDDILSSYENKGNVPVGIFYEIEKNDILDEIKALNESFSNLQIDKKKLITIELGLNCREECKLNENYIKKPPIEINFENKRIKIFGKIENISQKGLLFQGDDSTTNLVRSWFDILIFQSLEGDFAKDVIFLKNQKIRTFKIEAEKYLSKFLEYYLLSLKEPSYMVKPFISPILKEDQAALEKALTREPDDFVDEYSKWFFSHYETLDANSIIAKQAKFVKNVFEPILEED